MKLNPPKPVVIMGAGLSGLACALTLHRAHKELLVLEQDPEVGGRVKTRESQTGFLIDAGFQVLLNSYPELARFVELKKLELTDFDSGALIFDGTHLNLLANPFRHPQKLKQTIQSPLLTLKDKLLVALLILKSQRHSSDCPMGDKSTEDFLHLFGFSHVFIENFWRPFLTGVYLDENLSLGSDFFKFLIRCFGLGSVSLPGQGMGQLPKQMAEQLPRDSIRLKTQVKTWTTDSVTLDSGEVIKAEAVVCAFEPTSKENQNKFHSYRKVTTLYFTSPILKELNWNKWLVLIPRSLGYSINHLALLSSVSPSYSKQGEPLLSVSLVGEKTVELQQVIKEIEKVANRPLELKLVETTRILNALPIIQGQTPGFKVEDGIVFCGDYLSSPSINGALRSGRLAAEWIVKKLAEH
jgi:protoporphyrinogen oxidase